MDEQVLARPGGALAAHVYREAFHALDDGFCIIEVLFGDDGRAVDYRFLETNATFEQHTGLRDAAGRTARELVPDLEEKWFQHYGRVATTGRPARFVDDAPAMEARTFDVYTFRVGGDGSRLVAIHFADVSRRVRAERELQYASDLLETLVEHVPVGIYLLDGALRIVHVNPAARPAFGGRSDVVGLDFAEVLTGLYGAELTDRVVELFRRTLETGEAFHSPVEVAYRVADGTARLFDWRIDRTVLPGGAYGVVCSFHDVTEHIAARQDLAASEERYRTLFDSIDEGFCIAEMIYDDAAGSGGRPVDWRYVEVNPAFERHTGFEQAVGRTVREFVPDLEAAWFETLGAVAETGRPERFVMPVRPLGRWFDVYAFRIGAPDDRRVSTLFTDVTERVRADEALRASEAQLHHRANHDALTELPNRHLFEDRLRQAVAAAARHGRVLGLLFVDLDGFKLINDSYGHAAGDAALVEVARRLERSLREDDTLARMHGDEFTVLLNELAAPEDAEHSARTLLETLERPMHVGGKLVTVSASIGVAVFPRDAADAPSLVRAADAAMYRAKVAGKNDVMTYTSRMRAPAVERQAMIEALDGAMERGELSVLFQPQWDSRTGSVSTFEALLRWSSPTLGEVPPTRFVPIAEERGIFEPILSWSLEACGRCVRALSGAGGLPLRVAVNVSPSRLLNTNFRPRVEAMLRRHGLAPQQLELELGASAYLDGAEALRDAILDLKRTGVRVVLDRFGTDVGMVAPILDLPFDGVKLEAELVRRADDDPRLRRGLVSVVGVVHDFGLEVTAVGVETEAQRDAMVELGCERLQGTLIGAPMTHERAQDVLRAQVAVTLF